MLMVKELVKDLLQGSRVDEIMVEVLKPAPKQNPAPIFSRGSSVTGTTTNTSWSEAVNYDWQTAYVPYATFQQQAQQNIYSNDMNPIYQFYASTFTNP